MLLLDQLTLSSDQHVPRASGLVKLIAGGLLLASFLLLVHLILYDKLCFSMSLGGTAFMFLLRL